MCLWCGWRWTLGGRENANAESTGKESESVWSVEHRGILAVVSVCGVHGSRVALGLCVWSGVAQRERGPKAESLSFVWMRKSAVNVRAENINGTH